MELGYAFSSEEHTPRDLVGHAVAAERAGFGFGLISDHFHPWIEKQGHSPFVWCVLGAIANATESFTIGTGVTCPTIRIHPAIIAHAAATAACLMPGRFFLGIGTGENLNEHILGDKWPAPDERLEMLDEAVQVMRTLWEGGTQTHRGKHYTVENARVFDLPDEPISIAVAAAQPLAAELAGRIGDALITVSADEEITARYKQAGGSGPIYAQFHVCWHEDEQQARKLAHEVWPTAGIQGASSQELPLPEHFEQATENISEDDVAESVVCPDPQLYLDKIREFEQAGATHVYVHQIGDDQEASSTLRAGNSCRTSSIARSMRVVIISMAPRAVEGYVPLLQSLGHETVGVLTVRNLRRPEAASEMIAATPPGLDAVVVGSKDRIAPLLRSYEADVGLCAGFSWKLDAEALAAPRLGIINGHPSLLPQWRGPNPFGWTIRTGATEVGFTYHLMDEGLDTGPVLAQGTAPLPPDASIEDLFEQLPALSDALLPKALARIEAGDRGDSQTEEGASYASLYEDEYAEVDWTQPARDVHTQLRCWFLPTVSGIMGPVTTLDGERVHVLDSERVDGATSAEPGTVLERGADGSVLVACGDGAAIRVLRAEPV